MRRAALSAVFVVLFCASQANANNLRIDFDFSATTITATAGGVSINIPPDGSIMSAAASVTTRSSSLTNVLPGPTTLTGLTIDATLDVFIFLLIDMDGDILATQLGSAMGSLTAGLANGLVFPPSFLTVLGSIDCAGLACGAIAPTFPITFNGTQTINDTFTLLINNISINGSATVAGTLTINVAGITATIFLQGSEISRTFLPEPGLLVQLGAGGVGLLGLAGVRWRRGRARSRRR